METTRHRPPRLSWRQHAKVAGLWLLALATAYGAVQALGTGAYLAGILLTVSMIGWLAAAVSAPDRYREQNRRAAARDWEQSW